MDATGRSLGESRIPLAPPETTTEGASVQDPESWWKATTSALTSIVQTLPASATVRAIAVAGTSGTLLLSDEHGKPLSQALLYNDTTSRDALAPLARCAPPDAPVHTATSSLAKLLHLLAGRSPVRRGRALHQADWIMGRLCGHYEYSDENNALKLGYDPKSREWPEWIAALDLPPACLPKVYPAGTAVARIDPAVATAVGLPADVAIVTGTTDSTAAVIATGAIAAGEAVTALGSTLVLKVLAPTPIAKAELGVYSHRLGDLWLVGGASNSGGAAIAPHFSAERISELSSKMDPESPTGIDYYPLPRPGERFPFNDPGFPPRMTPRPASDVVFLQGLFEGIARIERDGYALLQSLGAPTPRRVISIGGGAANPAWRRIRERILGVPVDVATTREGAFGAAELARRGDTGG